MEKVKSRKVNSIRNVMFGIIYQIVFLLLSFVCRTILIRKLGADILGINGLYQDILAILSLAELGIGNVLLLGLYKPLANGDEKKICQTIQYYSKVYKVIALIVLIVGLAVLPFLNLIISNDVSISTQDVFIYYIIFLINSCFTYILCYRQAIINADQKNHIEKIVNCAINIAKYSLQIVFLFLIPNYKIYLVIIGIFNLLHNVILDYITKRIYPFLKEKIKEPLPIEDKKEIKKNIKNMFIYKIATVVQKNTDALFISTLVSTLAVGIYSNYNLVITAINGFINVIIYALFASVGSLGTEKNAEKSYQVFKSLLLFFQFIAVFCTICFLTVFNDFIRIWVGAEFLFDFKTVFIISFSFYISTAVSPIWMFRENFGLLKEVKYLMVASSIINIVLSFFLGRIWGIFGILLATIISKLMTTLTFEPIILYKKAFKVSPISYYLRQSLSLLILLSMGTLSLFIGSLLPSSLLWIFVKVVIIFVIVTTVFCVVFGRTKEFEYIKNSVKEILFKFKNKKTS